VYIFGLDFLADIPATQWLMYIAGATILLASLVALRQDNLKLRLAWSTVSQLSYIVLCALLVTPAGIVAGSTHMVMHGFAKITLFFCAGAILVVTHKTRVSELDGIGRRMPWTMTAFTIAAVSMIGIPPTAGFISKWYILLGTLESQQLVALGIIIASTLLNAAYFMPIVYAAFFREPATAADHVPARKGAEAPLAVLLAITVTAGGTLALFFFPDKVLELAMMTAGAGR
jgi:multicomponent Na+:H+ antiporter subunit D